MARMTDEELEGLLRRCGNELRLRSEEHARGAGAEERDAAVRRAVIEGAAAARRPRLGELVRQWLVPAQLAFACVLLLSVVYTLRTRPTVEVSPGTVPFAAPYEPSEADLAAAELDEAYAYAFPEYESLTIGAPEDYPMEDIDDEDEDFADI